MDHYAVIGHPIAHSKSPQIHTAFAAQTGEALEYTALLAPIDGFTRSVSDFRAQGGRGLNVTVPFKLEAHALAHRLTPRAEAAGAVNTLKFEGDDILGDNTDGAGLVRDLEHNLGFSIAGQRVLLLGAGGAARGAILPLLQAAPASLHIANRSVERARQLRDRFAPQTAVPLWGGGFADLCGGRFDLVINATAASLADQVPELPDGLYASVSLAYDMMYSRDDTPFMRAARAEGAARVADGLGMLVEQAAESFLLWRGCRPDTGPVLGMLRQG